MNQTAGMEKSCLRISTSERNIKDVNNTKVRSDPWDHHRHHGIIDSHCNTNKEGDLLAGFSWPPRSYTCSFCRRDFRSAQALGGHMNVHRRDRARLRQSPPRDNGQYSPLLNLNLDPNPNPNPSCYSFPSRKFPLNPTLVPFMPPSFPLSPLASSSAQMARGSKAESFPVVKSSLGHSSAMVKKEIVRLELEIGLKEDLDLELRLGCNT